MGYRRSGLEYLYSWYQTQTQISYQRHSQQAFTVKILDQKHILLLIYESYTYLVCIINPAPAGRDFAYIPSYDISLTIYREKSILAVHCLSREGQPRSSAARQLSHEHFTNSQPPGDTNPSTPLNFTELLICKSRVSQNRTTESPKVEYPQHQDNNKLETKEGPNSKIPPLLQHFDKLSTIKH